MLPRGSWVCREVIDEEYEWEESIVGAVNLFWCFDSPSWRRLIGFCSLPLLTNVSTSFAGNNDSMLVEYRLLHVMIRLDTLRSLKAFKVDGYPQMTTCKISRRKWRALNITFTADYDQSLPWKIIQFVRRFGVGMIETMENVVVMFCRSFSQLAIPNGLPSLPFTCQGLASIGAAG